MRHNPYQDKVSYQMRHNPYQDIVSYQMQVLLGATRCFFNCYHVLPGFTRYVISCLKLLLGVTTVIQSCLETQVQIKLYLTLRISARLGTEEVEGREHEAKTTSGVVPELNNSQGVRARATETSGE